MIHYTILELDLPEVSGTCTINGNPGYSTPLTCTDQTSPTIVTKTHAFTDANFVLPTSGIHKCLSQVRETPPKLKAGHGVASRANGSATFKDFIADPNPASPALTVTPSIKNVGTFFGKLKARNIIANKPVRVKYYQRDNGADTLISTHHYIATGIKKTGVDAWVLSFQDVLYRADDSKSQFPKLVTGKLSADYSASATAIVFEGDIADWTPFSNYAAVIGEDILMITNATGSSTSVTLTVARATTINFGSRTISNTPEDHSSGDEVFRARKFVDADLYDVLEAVFTDADITSDYYDSTAIQAELDEWLGNLSGSIDAIFYESDETTSFLNTLCSTFMLDIWTDIDSGEIQVKATSPWDTTTAVLTEGVEINYGTLSIDEDEGLYYSRAFLQYDKRQLTAGDDDVSFTRSSLAFNSEYEGANFYDEEKVKKLGKSIILSNKLNNIETADLTVVRFAQRFSNRPQRLIYTAEEDNISYTLGDVVEIISDDNQGIDGNAKQGVRAQVVQMLPQNSSIGRTYKVTAITYNPFIGGIAGSDIPVNATMDANLYTTAGGPTSADTFTFLVSNDIGQSELAQAIAVGSMPTGSTVNIVLLDGAVLMGAGGNGADVSASGSLTGFDGGDTLSGTSGVTVNVYLNGTTPDFGNGTYSADGYLYAPGGGGGAARSSAGANTAYAAGGGGQGNTPGTAGLGTDAQPNADSLVYPADGTTTSRGRGGTAIKSSAISVAGQGGTAGNSGVTAPTGEEVGVGGAAGRAIVKNGATVNVYTAADTGRFKQGSGDAPDTIS